MGTGASATSGRIFCHGCGARTAIVAGSAALRCGACGATEGVEVTDARLPVTLPWQSTGGTAVQGNAAGQGSPQASQTWSAGSQVLPPAEAQASASSSMRVESVTVVALPRPDDGGILLHVVPNVIARTDASPGGAARTSGDGESEGRVPVPEDWEVPPEPACRAFVSRLEAHRMETRGRCRGSDLCVICSEDLTEAGPDVVALACEHIFHETCIRRWLARRHTCPTCRLELEVDDVKYLRSIGLEDEADALEKVELERQAREMQKQAADRRRWVDSMRRGDPVHFGLTCSRCSRTPLVGNCYRCSTCEGCVVCTDCNSARQAPTDDWHPPGHCFVPFGSVSTGRTPDNEGMLTLLVPSPARHGQWEGEAATAAAEVAFAAVRSLALAPLAGRSSPTASPMRPGRGSQWSTNSRGRGR